MFGDMCSLEEAKRMVKNPRSLAAIERLERLYAVLQSYGVADYISFDLGMLSKYKYYTGVIFKAYTYGVGDAIVKGGRYDRLLQQFGKNNAPAVGFCAMIDSILEALSRQRVEIPVPETAKKLTYTEEDYREKLKEALELRAAGIAVTLTQKG
jgi:ATP phosphoribosyltransferase regulatory subunit